MHSEMEGRVGGVRYFRIVNGHRADKSADGHTGNDASSEKHSIVLGRGLDTSPNRDLDNIMDCNCTNAKGTHHDTHELHEALSSKLVAYEHLQESTEGFACDVRRDDGACCRITGMPHVCSKFSVSVIAETVGDAVTDTP